MKRESLGKIISIILLLLWCSLIFYFSNQVGEVSEESSSHVLSFINSILNIFSKDIDLNNSLIAITIVRKCAHMFLYFILYILCFNFSKKFNIKNKVMFCFIFCFLYATSDEIHQLFIFERSFGIIDILIDLSGSCIAYLLIKIINYKK